MTTTTEAPSRTREIVQANIERFADADGLSLEEVAKKAGVPVSAITGDRMFLRAIEHVARALGVTVDSVFGFGGCQPWCNAHADDGDSDYCCRRVGVYGPERLPIEIWHDVEGTRINFEDLPRGRECTTADARELVAGLTEALKVLDEADL